MLDFLVNHRDTESTERNLVLPHRETAIGQKNAALRAVSLQTATVPRAMFCSRRSSAEGGGTFPWPSSPGQGKNHLLCDLCVSVVELFQPYYLLLPNSAAGLQAGKSRGSNRSNSERRTDLRINLRLLLKKLFRELN